MSVVSAVDKGKGVFIPSPKKKFAPPTKSKGIVIGAATNPAALISKEEEEHALRGNDITLLPANVPMEKVSEEE